MIVVQISNNCDRFAQEPAAYCELKRPPDSCSGSHFLIGRYDKENHKKTSEEWTTRLCGLAGIFCPGGKHQTEQALRALDDDVVFVQGQFEHNSSDRFIRLGDFASLYDCHGLPKGMDLAETVPSVDFPP
jgi:hypothetical protein